MSVYYFINTAISNGLLKEVLKTGLICVGSKGCGKSNAVKVITRELLVRGLADVKVFDLALNWLFDFEQLPYQLVEDDTTIINAKNCIYDFTLTYNHNQINYTMQRLMKRDYHNKARMKLVCDGQIYNRLVYIIEEAQNVIGSSALRGKENHFWLKAISTSRNIGLSYIFIGQRLSDISTKAVERCNGYLLGKMTGDNDLRKVKALGGKELRRQVKQLEVGSFIYYNGDKTEQIDFPLFESYGRPKPYLETQPTVEMGSGLFARIKEWIK